MYKISDYLRNGVLYLNNTLRPHHKRLSTLMIYHQVPVALQALLYMEEARRASVLRGDKEDNDKQVHHKEYGCRAGGR